MRGHPLACRAHDAHLRVSVAPQLRKPRWSLGVALRRREGASFCARAGTPVRAPFAAASWTRRRCGLRLLIVLRRTASVSACVGCRGRSLRSGSLLLRSPACPWAASPVIGVALGGQSWMRSAICTQKFLCQKPRLDETPGTWSVRNAVSAFSPSSCVQRGFSSRKASPTPGTARARACAGAKPCP